MKVNKIVLPLTDYKQISVHMVRYLATDISEVLYATMWLALAYVRGREPFQAITCCI